MENSITINANSKEIIKDVLFQTSNETIKENGVKVLSVSATSKTTGCEALNGELRVSVGTTFNIIKAFEDGTYASEILESETTQSISSSGITPTTRAELVATVTDCSYTAGSNLKCKATVCLSGWFIKERTLTYLDSQTDGIYCKCGETMIENVIPVQSATTELTFTDEARMPLAQIIDYSGCVNIGSVYPADGSYRVDGDINFRVTAITDNGQFITQNFSHPFSTDQFDENINTSMKLDVDGVIKNLSFTITESDKRILVSTANVKFYGVALEEKTIQNVCDVYSTTNETEVLSETQSIDTHFCLRSVREKATANINVGNINEVLAVTTPMLSITGTRNQDGITTEGVIQTTVIYSDGEIRSQEAEIPFVSSIGSDYMCESSFISEVTVTALNARPRGGTEIEITAELLVTVKGVQSKETTLISGITIGREKEKDDFAISLYIVKEGETLWEVAKELNIDEETLRLQNEDVPLPLKGGEKIILYKQLTEI